MSLDNQQLHELAIRVTVLEQKNSHLENVMDALKKDFDHSRDENIRTHDKFQVRLSVIEQVVDDLKLNTELTKQSLVALEKMGAQMEHNNAALTTIQTKLSRQEGMIAGIVFLGGAAWVVLDKFGGPLLKLLGF